MAFRLKKIHYKNVNYHILLQNKNGACPLLAAANILVLKKVITLPPDCIKVGVVTIEELTNILAEKILSNKTASVHHINEVMQIFPNLQFGMDVNPNFTAGPSGVEYTIELNAFDMLHIELVHGWLLHPEDQEYEWVANQSYNQLVNIVIEGNDAIVKLKDTSQKNDCDVDELSNKATRGTVVRGFLDRSSHQLTQYGLTVLHEYIKEGNMVIFFRNNHFNLLTKFEDNLYLLVTDFGYASVDSVIWEKLDVIDGDTEYVNGDFKVPPPNDHQNSDAKTGDYQLALQLSRENVTNNKQPDSNIEQAKKASLLELKSAPTSVSHQQSLNYSTAKIAPAHPTIVVGIPANNLSQEERDRMLAMQLHRQEANTQLVTSRQQCLQQQLRTEQLRTKSNEKEKNSSCIIS